MVTWGFSILRNLHDSISIDYRFYRSNDMVMSHNPSTLGNIKIVDKWLLIPLQSWCHRFWPISICMFQTYLVEVSQLIFKATFLDIIRSCNVMYSIHWYSLIVFFENCGNRSLPTRRKVVMAWVVADTQRLTKGWLLSSWCPSIRSIYSPIFAGELLKDVKEEDFQRRLIEQDCTQFSLANM